MLGAVEIEDGGGGARTLEVVSGAARPRLGFES
jgi:hypothetical protein